MKPFVGLGAALTTFGILTLAFGPRHTHWNDHWVGHNLHRGEYHINCLSHHQNEENSTDSGGYQRYHNSLFSSAFLMLFEFFNVNIPKLYEARWAHPIAIFFGTMMLESNGSGFG